MGTPMLKDPLRRLAQGLVRPMVDHGPGARLLELAGVDLPCLHRPADRKRRLDQQTLFHCTVMIEDHGRPANGIPTGLAQALKQGKDIRSILNHRLQPGHLHGRKFLVNDRVFAHLL